MLFQCFGVERYACLLSKVPLVSDDRYSAENFPVHVSVDLSHRLAVAKSRRIKEPEVVSEETTATPHSIRTLLRLR